MISSIGPSIGIQFKGREAFLEYSFSRPKHLSPLWPVEKAMIVGSNGSPYNLAGENYGSLIHVDLIRYGSECPQEGYDGFFQC